MLSVLDNNVALLAFYNSLISVLLLTPLIIVSNEYLIIMDFLINITIDVCLHFWLLMILAGIVGFMISIVTNLQIKHTSPLTHNISGTAKACTQTVLATFIYNESKTFNWWFSNFIVLISSAFYTFFRQQEMKNRQ